MEEGWIRLHRKIRYNKYWLEQRRFSRLEAWIDLLLRAGFKDKELALGDVDLTLRAGQFVTSQVKLAEAWGWNRETVSKYLKRLRKDNQIGYKTSKRFTIISIVNWGTYQNPESGKPAIRPTGDSTIAQHLSSTSADTNNNGKNEKHINIMKSYFLELSKSYNKDKILIKTHLLRDGYTEFQIEEAFRKFQ